MAQRRKRYDKSFKIAAEQMFRGGEMRAVDLAREPGTKKSTLRRWAQECKEMGEDAIRNAEANQLCVGGATTATAPRASSATSAKPLLGTCPARGKLIESAPRVLLGAS